MGAEVGFDARTGALVELSAALARPDVEGWRSALKAAAAHAAGAEIEEALLQAHLFVGFPKVLDAFIAWREIAGTETAGAVAAVDRPGAGEALCRAVYGGVYDRLRDHVRRLHPELDVWMVEHGYGRTLSRSGLSVETRELCIVGLLAAAGHERQLRAHLHGALNVGTPPGRVEAALRVGIRQAARGPAGSKGSAGADSATLLAIWGRIVDRAGRGGGRNAEEESCSLT